jgi:hypothetical protein
MGGIVMHDEEEVQEEEKVFHVRIVATITLEIPIKLKNRVDAMEAAEATVKAQLQCFDKDAEVVGQSVVIREDEEISM